MKRRSGYLAGASLMGAACAGLVLSSSASHAEHFDVMLRVETPAGQVQSAMDTTPPIGGLNKRPVVKARSGDWVSVHWRMASAFPHGVMKDVTIHFFVVHEAAVGQKPVPNPAGAAGVVDNSLTMDFKPSAAATGAIRLKAGDPGAYLVRVQSENTYQEHGHEHFSAVDLIVEQ